MAMAGVKQEEEVVDVEGGAATHATELVIVVADNEPLPRLEPLEHQHIGTPTVFLSDWAVADEKDDKTRALLLAMRAEEQSYAPRGTSAPPSTSPVSSPKRAHSGRGHGPTRASPKRGPLVASTRPGAQAKKTVRRTSISDSAFDSSRRSSVNLPSHNTRWTPEEEERMRQGLEKYGRGNWKMIASVVGSRNALQVKNHARHMLQERGSPTDSRSDGEGSSGGSKGSQRRRSAEPIAAASPYSPAPTAEPVAEAPAAEAVPAGEMSQAPLEVAADALLSSMIQEPVVDDPLLLGAPHSPYLAMQASEDDIDIDVVESNDRAHHDMSEFGSLISRGHSPDRQEKSSTEYAPLADDLTIESALNEETEEHAPALSAEPASPSMLDAAEMTPTPFDDGLSHLAASPLEQSEGEEQHEAIHELGQLDRNSVSHMEKSANAEFFSGSSAKTPERYIKIRNHILDIWDRIQPAYVTKTAARNGLRDCGDVNVIGRVHQFLESIGAINVGHAVVPRPPRPPTKRKASDAAEASARAPTFRPTGPPVPILPLLTPDQPRRRRVRGPTGEWIDSSKVEGATIDHEQEQDAQFSPDAAEAQRLAALNARHFAEAELLDNPLVPRSKRTSTLLKRLRPAKGNSDQLDQFSLVPVPRFDARCPQPYRVMIETHAMLVMDFHSHLATTEVIGLLGGVFDPVEMRLDVLAAYPCNSLSTGMQCDMDPMSQVMAAEAFAAKGLSIVGWYHSHPTFSTNPSLRDLETQSMYQQLFRKGGVEPFFGVIVSPNYHETAVIQHSSFQFLYVTEEVDATGQYRVPRSLERTILPSPTIAPELIAALVDLFRKYLNYSHRVDLMSTIPGVNGPCTALDRILSCISVHLHVSDEARNAFLMQLRDYLLRASEEVLVQPADAAAHVGLPPLDAGATRSTTDSQLASSALVNSSKQESMVADMFNLGS